MQIIYLKRPMYMSYLVFVKICEYVLISVTYHKTKSDANSTIKRDYCCNRFISCISFCICLAMKIPKTINDTRPDIIMYV